MLMKLLGLKSTQKAKKPSKELKKFFSEDLNQDTKDYELKMADFNKIKEAVDKGINEDKYLDLLEKSDEVTRDELAVMIPSQYQALQQMMPINVSEDLFGVDEREPSDYEKSKFIRSVRVLQDPSHVLELMQSGTLTGTEVEALQTFYPDYYENLKQAILEAIAELHGKKDAKLSRQKNYILSMVLQVPRVNPETLRKLQTDMKQEEAYAAGEEIETAEIAETDVQRTLYDQ